jgi:hypothetical protein
MFDKTFKAKVQVWVLKYQIPIYSLFQLMLITTVGIIYPGVETHSLCMGGILVELNYNLLSVISPRDTGFSHGWYFTVGF